MRKYGGTTGPLVVNCLDVGATMTRTATPEIWLITALGGLSIVADTTYAPSLQSIAHYLNISAATTGITLSVYFFGLALSTLIWGPLADNFGRRPALSLGVLFFVIGSTLGFYANSFPLLIAARFIQSFGGSAGIVLAQTLLRDTFQGTLLRQAYAAVGGALACFPALCSLIGGYLCEHYGWHSLFLLLIGYGLILMIVLLIRLPETALFGAEAPRRCSFLLAARRLFTDVSVLRHALIVAACNGMGFSYFAEGSFALISVLGLSPSTFGLSFLCIVAGSLAGNIVARALSTTHSPRHVTLFGILTMLGATLVASLTMLSHHYWMPLSNTALIATIIGTHMIASAGMVATISTTLAIALSEYTACIGTASSLFIFLYYSLVSLFTVGMGLVHNGTLYAMPVYFFAISLGLLVLHTTSRVQA